MSDLYLEKLLASSKLLVQCFFALLEEGLLDEKSLGEKIQKGDLKKVEEFWEIDFSALPESFFNSLRFEPLKVVELIPEELNNYLSGKKPAELSKCFSDFDEGVSEDNFLNVIKFIPQENEELYQWFYCVWKTTFERVSSFEKSVTYAKELRMISADEISKNSEKLRKDIEDATKQVASLSAILEDAPDKDGLATKVANTSKELNSAKNEMLSTTVTILGIFAAIVLAFSGTFSFSASILQNLGNVSIYRLISVSAVLGIVAFNIIFCLFLFLPKGTKEDTQSRRHFSCLPMIITDFIFLLILVFAILAWQNDWLNKADSPDIIEKPLISVPVDGFQSGEDSFNNKPDGSFIESSEIAVP